MNDIYLPDGVREKIRREALAAAKEKMAANQYVYMDIWWKGFRYGMWVNTGMWTAAILAILLLAGCAQPGLRLTVIEHDTVEKAREACKKVVTDGSDGKAVACAQWGSTQAWCNIHIVNIAKNVKANGWQYAQEQYWTHVFGHEVRHCREGHFHPGRPH